MTVGDALRLGAERLRDAGIDGARREARLLLGHALGLDPASLLAVASAAVATEPYFSYIARRAAHEPLAYILGTREFWSLSFEVSPETLIPRPDSETLIEAAQAAFPDRAVVRRVLDLGTGTGCLLLAALTEFPAAFGIGLDRRPASAALARRNALRLGLGRRSAFLAGDWGEAVRGGFDLVLCNPPYVRSGDISDLMPEVAHHEPASALDGGADGLRAYVRILADLPRLLAPGGVAALELGVGQADAVAALAMRVGLTTFARVDLAGMPRALVCRPADNGSSTKNRLAWASGESSLADGTGRGRSAAPLVSWSIDPVRAMGADRQAGYPPEPTSIKRDLAALQPARDVLARHRQRPGRLTERRDGIE
jgi:release factor glutamine methyltransferase